jgi:benzodiazapine receptor
VAIHIRPLRREAALPLTARIEARSRPRPSLWARVITTRRLEALGIFAIYGAAAAVMAAYVETGPGTWYDSLAKPEYVRSEWLFGWVGAGVLGLMAIAAWLVWRRDWPEPERRRALAVLAAQLVIVSLWAPVLFDAHALDAALISAAAMWLVSLAALTTLAPANKLAAVLATPMLAWATYATGISAVLAIEA